MSIRELVELILEFNCDDFRQTAEDINELYRQLKLAPSQLLGEFEDICKENDRCIECGGKLKTEVIDKYFTNTVSRIGGITLDDIQKNVYDEYFRGEYDYWLEGKGYYNIKQKKWKPISKNYFF